MGVSVIDISRFDESQLYFCRLLPTLETRAIMLMKLKCEPWSSHHGAAETNLTRNREGAGSIPGLTQWVKDQCFPELGCRSQTLLGSLVAVAVAQVGSCSSDWTPHLGTSICCRCMKEKKKSEACLQSLTSGTHIKMQVGLPQAQKPPSRPAKSCWHH